MKLKFTLMKKDLFLHYWIIERSEGSELVTTIENSASEDSNGNKINPTVTHYFRHPRDH
jgi:hypothetical protein